MTTKLLSLVLLVAQAQSLQVLIHSSPVIHSDSLVVHVTLDRCAEGEVVLLFADSNSNNIDAEIKCDKSNAQSYICTCTFPQLSTISTTTVNVIASFDNSPSNSLTVYNSQDVSASFIDIDQDECDPFPTNGESCRYKLEFSTEGNDVLNEEDLLAGPGMFTLEIEGSEVELLVEQTGPKKFELSFMHTPNTKVFIVTAAADAVISSHTGRGNTVTTRTVTIAPVPPVVVTDTLTTEPTPTTTTEPTTSPDPDASPVPLSGEGDYMCGGTKINNQCTATDPTADSPFREKHVGEINGLEGCACDEACIGRKDCCQAFFKKDCCIGGDCVANNQDLAFDGEFLQCDSGKCFSSRMEVSETHSEYTCYCDPQCQTDDSCCGGVVNRDEVCE